jgi:hypothetical protein
VRAPAVSLVIAVALFLTGTAVAAPDRKPPRMTAAAMQDQDRDGHADRVVLTYSERIRHPRDADGRYPFRVGGYRVSSVGAASGKNLVLLLVEKGSLDAAVRPAVSYARTKSKPVRDAAGNQARGQTFRKTTPHGYSPPPPAPPPPPPDTTPPDTMLLGGPSGTAASRTATFTYASPDPTAAFECALDGAALTPCSAAGQTYTGLGDGAHTFQVRARDAAGNVDATPESRTWSVDGDGDGSMAPADCAPDNASIHPGAADAPDVPAFADTNCDGIDGNVSDAVFVSPSGSDANPGTRAQPERTLEAALINASATNRDVYAAAGVYPERLDVMNGVSVFGGYDSSWSRSLANQTSIEAPAAGGSSEGAVAVGITSPTTLQLLRVTAPIPAAIGGTSYGLRGTNCSGLVIDRLVAVARAGGPGSNGAHGAPGRAGGRGGDAAGLPTMGGPGGTSVVGRSGGSGGNPQLNSSGLAGGHGLQTTPDAQGRMGGPGGPGGTGNSAGGPGYGGDSGVRGGNGTGGQAGNANGAMTTWVSRAGTSGTRGTAGHGGGGGGGGAATDGRGGAGGGGGGGGEGGGPGTGGGGGGGSFGIYLQGCAGAVVQNSSFQAANGGAGGPGGFGALGGAGGGGGLGSTGGAGGRGGNGGLGGPGGIGGDGGGGAGGPSFALYATGGSVTTTGNTYAHGNGGAAGSGAGTPAVAGASGNTSFAP